MMAETVSAQAEEKDRFMVKAHAGFALGSAYSTKSVSDLISTSRGRANDAGVDFGYTFFRRGKWGVSVNTGLAVTIGSQTLSATPLSYNYEAAGSADMDGDSYIRYVETSPLREKTKTTQLTLPLYLDADWQLHRRFSVFAQAGLRLGFKMNSKTTIGEASCTSYGVYPEYGNLVIDEDYLNDFGTRMLTTENSHDATLQNLTPQFMFGLGARVNLWKPLWAELSLSYRYGGDVLKCDGKALENGRVTEDDALVKYTVASGTRVENLTGYLSKDRVSQLSLSIGIIYKF